MILSASAAMMRDEGAWLLVRFMLLFSRARYDRRARQRRAVCHGSLFYHA